MQGLVARVHRLPELARMGFTALLGVLLGWLTYELLYCLNPLAGCRATSSWGLGWTISVWRQHALHRWLTFSSRAPYGKSLRQAYLFYAASGALGGLTNLQLTAGMGVHHRIAWLICLGITGLVSVLFLKRLVFQGV